MGMSYVNITTSGCKGWLNLFIDEHCIALVNNAYLADKIRSEIDEKIMCEHKEVTDVPSEVNENNFVELQPTTEWCWACKSCGTKHYGNITLLDDEYVSCVKCGKSWKPII